MLATSWGSIYIWCFYHIVHDYIRIYIYYIMLIPYYIYICSLQIGNCSGWWSLITLSRQQHFLWNLVAGSQLVETGPLLRNFAMVPCEQVRLRAPQSWWLTVCYSNHQKNRKIDSYWILVITAKRIDKSNPHILYLGLNHCQLLFYLFRGCYRWSLKGFFIFCWLFFQKFHWCGPASVSQDKMRWAFFGS